MAKIFFKKLFNSSGQCMVNFKVFCKLFSYHLNKTYLHKLAYYKLINKRIKNYKTIKTMNFLKRIYNLF